MRVKTGIVRRKRHKKILKEAKGFRGHRGRSVRGAMEGVLNALSHAYIGRKHKKRNMRALWIQRLNAAVREHGISYSKFVQKLNNSKIQLDRKILSEVAQTDPDTFKQIFEKIVKDK